MNSRLSTKLMSNALTTYLRLGVQFLLGIFLVWYLAGAIGLEGYGMLGLASGAFGITSAVFYAINAALTRELAASIASGDVDRVRRTFVSALAYCAMAAVAVFAFSAVLALVALVGVFKTGDEPHMDSALAALFASAGVHTAVRLLLSPYEQAIYSAQRIAMDNILQFLVRLVYAGSTIVAFSVLLPEAPLHQKLYGFAVVHAVLLFAHTALGVVLARRMVEGLEIRFSAFDRAEFKSIAATCWHTGHFKLLVEFNPLLIAVLINLFFGVAFNGIWTIVMQIAGYSRLVAEGLQRGLDPLAAHLKEQQREHSIIEVMIRSIRYQLAVTLPWVATFLILMTQILPLWFGARLARQPELLGAGMTVQEALDLIAVMSAIYLVAMTGRVATQGVERLLYGAGEVRSYAWFAKWAAIMALGLATILFWLTDSPIGAPVALLVVHVAYFDIVVPRAAARRMGFPIGEAMRRSLPRPVLATILLSVVVGGAALAVGEVNLPGLIALIALAGAVYAPLCLLIVLTGDERARLRQMATSLAGRARPRRAVSR